jgi:uncharacterized membrane protein
VSPRSKTAHDVGFAPLASSMWRPIAPPGCLINIASGAAEALYSVLLGAAYKHGDLSMVYPLSRGSSPVFVTLFAVLLPGERPSLIC